jgi:hypothetical protein
MPNPPSGFTVILTELNGGGVNYSNNSAIYRNYTSALGSATFTTGSTGSDVGMIIDVLA